MKFSAFLFVFVAGLVAHAQESIPTFETVVEDQIFNTSEKVVIDEKTIKESRAPSITSLLSSQANITVVSTPFQPNSIFIRGGDASHVLIIVDGVPFYDASTVQRTFNLNSLDIKSVRRIEIIKGGQSVLYGGQALSGVIKIDTIPQEFTTKSGLMGQIGTQNFRDISAAHTQALDDNHAFLFRGHGAWKDMESPVLDSSKVYPNNNWNTEGAYAWKGPVDGNIKAIMLQDLNYSPGTSRTTNKIYDTEDFEQFTRQIGASGYFRFNEVAWQPRLAVSAQNSQRDYTWPTIVPVDNPSGTEQKYGANLHTARIDATPYKEGALQITSGLSYIYEDFVYRNKGVETNNSFSEQRGFYLKADYAFNDAFSMAAGGRVESWGDNDPVGTYQVGATFFNNTKFEVASGYKIPSLFQLYSSYGNPNLEEENAIQYSLQQDWNVSDRQSVSVTLFYSKYSDLIQVTGTPGNMKYNNVDESETRGVDFAYTLKVGDGGTLLASYGYQEPRDITNDRWLLRRPLVNGSLKYMQNWEQHTGAIEFVGAGERLDSAASGSTTTLPAYMIANAAYSYRFDERTSFFTRLNNLADYRYEESYSYYSEGFSGSLGAEIWF